MMTHIEEAQRWIAIGKEQINKPQSDIPPWQPIASILYALESIILAIQTKE